MVCPSCRAQIEDGSNICSYCGYSFIPSHSRQAAKIPPKVDYDLNQRMQEHLERNGHSEGPPGRADINNPADGRRIVAPPPPARKNRPQQPPEQQPTQPAQPLQVDISNQQQLPRVSSQPQNTAEAKAPEQQPAPKKPAQPPLRSSASIRYGQRIEHTNFNTANPAQVAQQLGRSENGQPITANVVGASDIRHRNKQEIPGSVPGAYYSVAQENRQDQPPRRRPTNREMAEQLVGEVMTKLSQPRDPQPMQRPPQQLPPRQPVQPRQQPAPPPPPRYQQAPPRPQPQPQYVKQPEQPRQPVQPAASRPAYHLPSYGPELFNEAQWNDGHSRPMFGLEPEIEQPAPPPQPEPVYEPELHQEVERPQQQTEPPKQEWVQTEWQEPKQAEPFPYNPEYTPDFSSYTMEQDDEADDEEQPAYTLQDEDMEAGKYASPMMGTEVYQSETYFSTEEEEHFDNIPPAGDEGVKDEVPDHFSPEDDIFGFAPQGDEGVEDEVPEQYLLHQAEEPQPTVEPAAADAFAPEPFGDEIFASDTYSDTYVEEPFVDEQAAQEFAPATDVNIPGPDDFITADSNPLKDIHDAGMKDNLTDFISPDESFATAKAMRYEEPAKTTRDDLSNHHFDQAVDSDEAPTQPVSRTFHESPLASEEKKKRKSVWILVGLLALALVVVIGYSLNLWISRSYGSFDNMLTALFGGYREPEIDIKATEYNGKAAHQITVKSSHEGVLVLESIRDGERVNIVGGVASAIIEDNYWIGYSPEDGITKKSTQAIEMHIEEPDGNIVELPSQSYEVDVPQTKASVEFEDSSKQTSSDTFEIYVLVEPGVDEVSINGVNMQGAVSNNKLTYPADLQMGPNTFEIVVRTRYCTAYKESVTITKVAGTGNPSSPIASPAPSGDAETITPGGEQTGPEPDA